MSISNKYRRISELLASCTLCATCLLLSGCERLAGMMGHGPEPNYPAFLLHIPPDRIDKDKKINLVFDWDKISIGGRTLTEIAPEAKYWRLSFFYAKDQSPIDAIDSSDPKGFIEFTNKPESRRVKVRNLPTEYSLQADIDLILGGTPKDPTDGRTLSFVVLLHEFPEPSR